MTIDITQIIVALIGVIGTILASLITARLVPWLKSKLTANQIAAVAKFIYSGVKAAETLFPEAGSGAKKFQYVLDSAKAFCESNNITIRPILWQRKSLRPQNDHHGNRRRNVR